MKVPFWNSLPARWRRISRWVIGLLLAYTIFGFLVLPLIVRAVAVKKLSTELHREVSIRTVRLNPFVLSASIRGLLIKDKDGEPFVSWDEVYVNFQLASFFGQPWVFKEVRTVNPYVRVQVNKDFSVNFADLIAPSDSTNAPSAPGKPLALRIDRLHVAGARAAYADLTPRTPFTRVLGPLDVTLDNFRTDPGSKNPYSFAGTTDAGEKFAWSGHFFLSPLRSHGDLSLENIALNKYSPLYEDLIRVVVKDGVVDLRSTYSFELSESNRVASVTNVSFSLHSLKISEPHNETNLVELQEFAVTGASVDAIARRAEIASITGAGGHLLVRRDASQAVNLVELSKPADTATNAPGGILLLLQSVTNAVAMLLNSTNQWSATIHDVALTGGAVTLEDFVNSRPVRLELADIAVNAKHLSNVPGTNLTAEVSLRWNTNGTIKVNAEASFTPPTADVQIALDQLDLKPLDPYLESKINVFILGSKLGLDGKLRLRTATNGFPEVSFAGDSRLDDFATVDGVLGEDLLKWKSVRVTGLEANLQPPTIAIKEINITDAEARVVVETNRTINLLAALRSGETNTAPEPTKTLAANVTNAPTTSSLAKLSIASVVFSNAQLRLADRSIQPNVKLAIQQLSGTVANLSSDDLQHADVNLHASVDGVGPVEITGTINPLGQNLTTDLKIVAKNVDLTPTSPYSGKFAGYRIARGKLGLELSYKISGRKLTAKNLIILDQFTFGERVDSPDATKLPIKLAVAVLKDRSGKIELDVPIDGSLDDPQFHLGKVINRAILNVITKIVTSPFAVLGSLFGGKTEELNFVEFAPGSATLSPEGKTKLDSLAKGLYERPALQLDLEGGVNPEVDRDGLRGVALGKQMRSKKWMSLRKSERANLAPDQITLTGAEASQWIETLYKLARDKGELKPLPAVASAVVMTNEFSPPLVPAAKRASAARETEKGASALLNQSNLKVEVSDAPIPLGESSQKPGGTPRVTGVSEMGRALLNAIPVTDGDLQTLASDRAKAVREYLQQSGKVESDRVFLVENQGGELNAKGNRVLLQLK
ncbi:MAG: DUF748 domain-containing protein [Pedosphaera sp.]|nr:DUF748 domain-containing protein [Pedosphaera sp.]